MNEQNRKSSEEKNIEAKGSRRIPKREIVKKVVLFIVVASLFAGAYLMFGDVFSLQSLAKKEAVLREYQQDHSVLVYGMAFAVYVTVTALSLPGAAAMTLIMGWFLGLWRGVILVSFASTLGATLAFLFSRYLLRDTIQNRFGTRLESFNEALRREGAFYLFTLRLIPLVPFFVINLVMGLTPLRVKTFWWISQLGMLPGTVVFVYAGSSVPTLQILADKGAGSILSLQLLAAFVFLGIFPILIKKLMAKIRHQN